MSRGIVRQKSTICLHKIVFSISPCGTYVVVTPSPSVKALALNVRLGRWNRKHKNWLGWCNQYIQIPWFLSDFTSWYSSFEIRSENNDSVCVPIFLPWQITFFAAKIVCCHNTGLVIFAALVVAIAKRYRESIESIEMSMHHRLVVCVVYERHAFLFGGCCFFMSVYGGVCVKQKQKHKKKRVMIHNICKNCHKNNGATRMAYCGQCWQVQYCCKKCQRLDWPLHKHECYAIDCQMRMNPLNVLLHRSIECKMFNAYQILKIKVTKSIQDTAQEILYQGLVEMVLLNPQSGAIDTREWDSVKQDNWQKAKLCIQKAGSLFASIATIDPKKLHHTQIFGHIPQCLHKQIETWWDNIARREKGF